MREIMDIKSMTPEELKIRVEELGEKGFRSVQLYQWMHEKLAEDYEEMSNLSKGFRERLMKEEPLTRLEMVRVQESKLDGTRKYLFRLGDGNLVESVSVSYTHLTLPTNNRV